ncbi:Thioesterase/thiol ester dehydrase-isomerase [Epithele typhae]|uniref:Thioesterase/thiol ester dehydrase-isomerase n=1 Tax=Epithele typhae TaxID=378194 RepID=UPI002007FDD7|nr:Thioesterase/thiol ester dehydrase-isomerase [Epithele typhae]KAH9922846.1 Thioesterase/thiol ester dehydrase-isomerase [Epithele typhae]
MSACMRFTRRVSPLTLLQGSNSSHPADQRCFPNGQYMTGVSVDIGTSFVKPAGRVGEELTATAVANLDATVGKSLAYTRVDFYNVQGQLAAYGHHTKYVGKSAGHKNDVKFSDDGETVVEGKDVD